MSSIAKKIYTKKGIVKENIFEDKSVLHLGCGHKKLKGAKGVDILKISQVDVVHNLDNTPWPFENSSADIIFAHSSLEHLDNIIDFFNEVWRIGKDGCRLVISVPYFRSVDSFSDPTHKHFFTSKSLDYFIDLDDSLANYEYTKNKFKKIGFWYGWPQKSNNFLVNIFKKFIQKNQKFYDQYLSLIIPVKMLIWEPEVKK